jgi:hypothetical protein
MPQHASALITALQNTDLGAIAAAFCDLQEARHAADYDHLAPFPKVTVLDHVDSAERAIGLLAGADPAERQTFFALLAVGRSLR